MDDKSSSFIGSVCAIVGGALLLYSIVDQAAKSVAPEIKKLAPGEVAEEAEKFRAGAVGDDLSEPEAKHEECKPEGADG